MGSENWMFDFVSSHSWFWLELIEIDFDCVLGSNGLEIRSIVIIGVNIGFDLY